MSSEFNKTLPRFPQKSSSKLAFNRPSSPGNSNNNNNNNNNNPTPIQKSTSSEHIETSSPSTETPNINALISPRYNDIQSQPIETEEKKNSSKLKLSKSQSSPNLAVSNTSSKNRIHHTSVLHDDCMYIYGGLSTDTSQPSNDLYGYNLNEKQWTTLPPIKDVSGRYQHTAVVFGNAMYIFGGAKSTDPQQDLLNDIIVFNFEAQTWSLNDIVSDELKPQGRRGHASVVCSNHMYVFGGLTKDSNALNDLWCFNFDTKIWTNISLSTPPSPRSFHSLCLYKDSLWLYGGVDEKSVALNDVLCLSLSNESEGLNFVNVNFEGESLNGKFKHAAVVYNNALFVFGGEPTKDNLEVFELDLESKTWSKVKTNNEYVPRSGHSAILKKDTVFLFGGSSVQSENEASLIDSIKVDEKGSFVGDTEGSESSDEIEETRGNETEHDAQDAEPEVEAVDDEISKMQKIPKSQWEGILVRKYPEILELRERTRQLSTAKTYALSTNSSITEDRNHLAHQLVLQLIMEHLATFRYFNSIKVIQEESKVPFTSTIDREAIDSEDYGYNISRLAALLSVLKGRLQNLKGSILDPDLIFDEGTQGTDDEGGVGVQGADADPEVQVVDHLPGRMDIQEEEDVNIWDEPADSRKNIVKGGKEEAGKVSIRAASLNKLVQYLTSDKEKGQDVGYMKVFLYTYQSFTTPEALLKKLIQRYHVPELPASTPKEEVEKYKADIVGPVQNKVSLVLKFWIEKCAWDFNSPHSEKLLNSLHAFIDGPLSRDGHAKQLRNAFAKTSRKKHTPEESQVVANFPEPRVPKNIFSPTLTLKDIDELEIARQLTLIEFDLFASITPTEFLNKGWLNPHPHRAPRIRAMMNRAQDMGRWVMYMILTQEGRKPRARMLDKFIKVAEHLKSIRNFQSMMSILSGLGHHILMLSPSPNSSPTPLRTPAYSAGLQQELPIRSREVLSELLSLQREESYHQYRELLKSCNPLDNTAPVPYIPFLDVLLQDLVSVEDGHPDFINNLINFQKRQLFYNEILKIQDQQKRSFSLQPVHQVATFLTKLPKTSEKELEELAKKGDV